MNDTDRNIIFQQIFSILSKNISQWSVIEVEQFLQLINCGQFEKIARFFGVNGQMLLEPTKIEALMLPQIKPNTTLLYEKLMFMLEELKPTQYRKSNTNLQRHSRDTISIKGNLMKTIRNAIDFVKQKSIVKWTNEDLISFLNAVGLDRFKDIIERTACDGLIMLYVVPDRRKMLRMSKYFEAKQLQQIVHVSQILLAQYFMVNDTYEDIEEIELSPKQHSEIVFSMKRVQSYESITQYPEDLLIVQSMESAYEQNDFMMTEDGENASILEVPDTPEKQEEQTEKQQQKVESDMKVSLYDQKRVSFMKQEEGPVRESVDSMTVSQYPEEVLDQSQYPENQSCLKSRMSALKSYQLSESIIGENNSSNRNSVNGHGSVQLDESNYNQLASSYYPQEVQNNNLLQNSVLFQDQSIEVNVNKVLNEPIKQIKSTNEALQKYKAELNLLKSMTLSMPFNLLSFKSLNWIMLGQVKKSNKGSDPSQESECIGDKQSFGVHGCKFGRDGTNDYSYPDEISISHKHAMIFFKDRNFYLQDLASKTGTFIQIDQIEIYDGLIIQLAFEVQITFQIISRQKDQGAIKVIFKLPTNMPNYQANIPNKLNSKIGRSKNCKILIDSNNVSVSQKHAEISYEDQKFYFRDLNSQNGSWRRLSLKGVKSELFPLQAGDNIRISSKKRLKIMNIQVKDL